MLSLHQRSVKCSLLSIMILHIQETCGFLKGVLATSQYEYNISNTANLEKSMKIDQSFYKVTTAK